ncbi:hypothetical protein LG200_11490 [Methylobacillus caricis]|uniref:hypothetical protein n=1 Tax=Methylobacillus caricis TaxID=1971611 RepID=UPI001CFF6ED8|nr:hypothetical protein [Methylobacillus caricis]MCB5188621.1 hypothetical protein [Methylobacillus caricis]
MINKSAAIAWADMMNPRFIIASPVTILKQVPSIMREKSTAETGIIGKWLVQV